MHDSKILYLTLTIIKFFLRPIGFNLKIAILNFNTLFEIIYIYEMSKLIFYAFPKRVVKNVRK